MFWRYLLACGVPFPAKIRMIAYLCTYISMAFAFYGIVGYLAVSAFDRLCFCAPLDSFPDRILFFHGVGRRCITAGRLAVTARLFCRRGFMNVVEMPFTCGTTHESALSLQPPRLKPLLHPPRCPWPAPLHVVLSSGTVWHGRCGSCFPRRSSSW